MFETLRARYRAISTPKKAALWITVSSFFVRGLSFITVPIFTRLLSTSEYGEFSVYQSWESVFVYVVTLGVAYGGFNNGMMRYPDDREGYTSSVAGLICSMGLFWFTLALIFQGPATSLLGMPESYILLMFVEVVASEVYDVWACRARFDFEYRKLVAVAVFLGVGVPAVGIPAVMLSERKVLARIISYVAVYAVMAAVIGVAMLRRSRRVVCWDYWRFTLAFNVPLLPHYLAQVVLSSSDRLMIGRMCSTSDAGVYSIAYSLGMLLTILSNSLNSVIMPWLYRTLKADGYEKANRVGLEVLALLAVTILMVDALAPDLVAILAPAKYGEAMSLVPVIATSVFFMYLYSYCSNIEFYWEKTRMATVASVAAAVLNIVLNAVFIPLFGYQAAAWTTLACYMVLGITHYLAAQHVARQKTGRAILDGRIMWAMALALVAVSAVFARIYAYPVARYALLALIVIVFIANRKTITSKFKEIREEGRKEDDK